MRPDERKAMINRERTDLSLTQHCKPNLAIDRGQDHRPWIMRAFETDQRFNPDVGVGKRTH